MHLGRTSFVLDHITRRAGGPVFRELMRRGTTLLVAAGAGLLLACGAAAQQQFSPQVSVYSTYFVADERAFASLEELRAYLLAASNDFYSVDVRDCAAKDRVPEVLQMMRDVVSERAARRGQNDTFAFFLGTSWPPACAPERPNR